MRSPVAGSRLFLSALVRRGISIPCVAETMSSIAELSGSEPVELIATPSVTGVPDAVVNVMDSWHGESHDEPLYRESLFVEVL